MNNKKNILKGVSDGIIGNGIFKGVPVAELEKIYATASPQLLTQLFTQEIQPLLFRGNSFMSRALNDDAFVNYNSVNLANAGTTTSAQINRTFLPAPIAPRIDIATEYDLEEISVDPVVIGYSEELTVSYRKRESVLQAQAKTIMQKAGDRCLQKWASGADATHTIAATGTLRNAGNSNGAQTGTRHALTIADITNVQSQFFRDSVNNELEDINGVAVITPAQYQDLMQIANFSQYLQYGTAIVPTGVIRRAFGFDFYVRNLVVNLDNTITLKAEGAVGAATDHDGAVFYSPSYVRRAVGPYVPFIEPNKAAYYGTLFSAVQRFGARAARNDAKGLVILYE